MTRAKEISACFGRRHGRLILMASLVGLIALNCGSVELPSVAAQEPGRSVRFYGHGVDDIDRIKILIDPPVPADIGATDFTLEWWMKASLTENGSPTCVPGGDNWIYGNIIFDRDIWGSGDYGDYGISLANGRITFGVNNGTQGQTLCGSQMVADGTWHHVAVTRRLADGLIRVFVDGQQDAEASGPPGDISYRDGRPAQYEDDPYLVIGAEKHDAGPEYPSYSGWIDEVRLSQIVRYTSDFVPPSGPFVSDDDTVALYHLDGAEAGPCIGEVLDSSAALGGPSTGNCNYGGDAPAGPVYSTDMPFSEDLTPPTILNVDASPFWTFALVTWKTDEEATSLVTYGISPTLEFSTTESMDYVTVHAVFLRDLLPDNAYVYTVRSRDRSGNVAVSDVFRFWTLVIGEGGKIYVPFVE